MGKTSSKVKNRYNEKVYDRLNIVVPKGRKSQLQDYAQSRGESLNGFVNRAIDETIGRDKVEKSEES
jgi:predicted HicB family RNase H-like nuclease